MKILIADDNEVNRKLITEVIKVCDENIEYKIVNDGAETVEALAEEYFDIIILDVMMPKLSGIQVCKSVKALVPETKVIVISANKAFADEALKAGADAFLTKPINMEHLINTIKEESGG